MLLQRAPSPACASCAWCRGAARARQDELYFALLENGRHLAAIDTVLRGAREEVAGVFAGGADAVLAACGAWPWADSV